MNELLDHCIIHHEAQKLSFRRCELNEKNGDFVLVSKHFPVTIKQISECLGSGRKCVIDIDNLKIRFKRERGEDTEKDVKLYEQDDQSQEHSILTDKERDVFIHALHAIKDSGRGDDFISVLDAIANGTIPPHHISLHLLLDIGNFLSANYINKVRYNAVTMDFWALVQKMFKGKAIRFFRGPMSCELEQNSGIYGYFSRHGTSQKFMRLCRHLTSFS